MQCEFSETAYAFSLISEIIRTGVFGRIIKAPIAPSTVEEGETGYDLELITSGKPLFLQFKVPDFVKRKMPSCPSPLSSPFFKIKMRKTPSDQHNILKRLSDQKTGSVFYVAPTFFQRSEFDDAFIKNEVCKRSAFFSLNNLPLINDTKQHHIFYKTSGRYYCAKGYYCSEPKLISDGQTDLIGAYLDKSDSVDISRFCRRVFNLMKETEVVIPKNNEEPPDDEYRSLQRLLFKYGVCLVFVE